MKPRKVTLDYVMSRIGSAIREGRASQEECEECIGLLREAKDAWHRREWLRTDQQLRLADLVNRIAPPKKVRVYTPLSGGATTSRTSTLG